MITNIEEDPRIAGEIRRFHTWKVHHQQSVGEHTWQAMRIMMTIDAGMCSQRLMQYAMFHDVGEMVGDLPWPVKRNDPVLKGRMEVAEQQCRVNMRARWGQPALPVLSEMESSFFKMCESIEMWEFGLQEQNLGNKYGRVVAGRMLLAASKYMENLPVEVCTRALGYIETRREQERETEDVDVRDPRHISHGSDLSDETIHTVEKQ